MSFCFFPRSISEIESSFPDPPMTPPTSIPAGPKAADPSPAPRSAPLGFETAFFIFLKMLI
jgi:hypothetical protein